MKSTAVEAKAEKASPEEKKYLQAARPFVDAIVKRDYTKAHGLLSPHATARMSLNQFLPAQDDAQFAQNEANVMMEVSAEKFIELMGQVEAHYGTPRSSKGLYVHNLDPKVLSGEGEALDSMFAIGGMPKSTPMDIRRASLRGQITTKLSAEQLKEAAKIEGLTPEELEKDPDFSPYFTTKIVLIEEDGALKVGYFELLPPSMLD